MSKKGKLGVTPPAYRKRLALELHDGAGQILTGIKFRLQSLPERLSMRSADEADIRKLCRDYKECAGGKVTVRTVSTRATPELSLTLFRIAQEALNNIGKHSRATRVAVSLSCEGEDVVLIVKDNGVGFVSGSRRHGGHGIGLGNMRRRAEAAGGWLELCSRRGTGTTLSVRVPASGLRGGAS